MPASRRSEREWPPTGEALHRRRPRPSTPNNAPLPLPPSRPPPDPAPRGAPDARGTGPNRTPHRGARARRTGPHRTRPRGDPRTRPGPGPSPLPPVPSARSRPTAGSGPAEALAEVIACAEPDAGGVERQDSGSGPIPIWAGSRTAYRRRRAGRLGRLADRAAQRILGRVAPGNGRRPSPRSVPAPARRGLHRAPSAGAYLVDFGGYAQALVDGRRYGGLSGERLGPRYEQRPHRFRRDDPFDVLRKLQRATAARWAGAERVRWTTCRVVVDHGGRRRVHSLARRPARPAGPDRAPRIRAGSSQGDDNRDDRPVGLRRPGRRARLVAPAGLPQPRLSDGYRRRAARAPAG